MYQTLTSGQFLRRNETFTLFSLTFTARPLGFEVRAGRDGNSVVVSEVHSAEHLQQGLRVGSSIAEINSKYVVNMSAGRITALLRSEPLPLTVLFKQELLELEMKRRPLGLCLAQCERTGGVLVSRIYSARHRRSGLRVGSFVYKLGSRFVDGVPYATLMAMLVEHPLPFVLSFRKFDVDDQQLALECHNKQQLLASWLKVISAPFPITAQAMAQQSVCHNNTRCGKLTECPCIARVVFILRYYQRWVADRARQRQHQLFRCSMQQFLSSLLNYELCQLLNDYQHIVRQHAHNNLHFQQMYNYLTLQLAVCQNDDEKENQCLSYQRTHASRRQCNHERYFLSQFDAGEIALLQHLDKIHTFMFHCEFFFSNQYDTSKEDLQNSVSALANVQSQSPLEIKRNELKQLRGVDRMRRSKFITVTDQHENKEDDSKQEDGVTGKEQMPFKLHHGYQFGCRYHYWNFYNQFNEVSVFLVAAKYANLKQEMLANGMSEAYWMVVSTKAEQLQSTTYCKARMVARRGFGRNFGIQEKSLISVQHLMSALFYSNFDQVRIELSDTYFKMFSNESYNRMKIRHAKYAQLAKLLNECCQVFGDEMSKKQQFMHSINQCLMFDMFSAEFHSPTSCTTSMAIAHTFADENSGLILILGSEFNARNLDLSWISDFTAEREHLIMGGQYLELRSMIDVRSQQNYHFFMDAMKVFQILVSGEYILHKISNSIISLLLRLLNNELDLGRRNRKQDVLPPYMAHLFHHYCKNVVRELTVRMCYLSERFISKHLRKYFITTKNDMLKLDILFDLFPNVTRIRVTYEQQEGIILSDSSFDFFLTFLKQNRDNPQLQLDELLIRPNDSKSKNIQTLVETYKQEFERCGVTVFKETNVFGDDFVCFERQLQPSKDVNANANVNQEETQTAYQYGYGYCVVM